MKYVHVFNGLEHEAPEGSLNWPWVSAEQAHVRGRLEAAKQAGRDHVEAELAAAAKRGPGRPKKSEPPDA